MGRERWALLGVTVVGGAPPSTREHLAPHLTRVPQVSDADVLAEAAPAPAPLFLDRCPPIGEPPGRREPHVVPTGRVGVATPGCARVPSGPEPVRTGARGRGRASVV
ncbi:hypothetical protein ACIQ9P_08355 [Kitasatospora sp. NPDC094019]|uniref:hypothetical protein n=1 Tax=Kitasatospora sp. NPDC094019 TaxID=3364091 RepID=UPI003827E234